jgi:hypothetical protein
MPKITVVSITSNSFKVAAFRQEGSFRKHLLSYKAYSADDFTSQKYLELKKHLSNQNVSAIISRDMCAVRYLTLPSDDPHEIERMVELQKPKLFPFKYRQAIVQPIICDSKLKGVSRVMVVVIPAKILYEKLQILNLAGIYPRSLYLSSLVLFERFNDKFAQTDTHRKNCLIINIENNCLDIIISKKESLVFTYGSQLPSDRQAACARIISDLERAIRIFRKDHQEEVERIIVNSSSYTANLLSVIENRMHTKGIVSNALELMEAASHIQSKRRQALDIMPDEILRVNIAYKVKKFILLPGFSLLVIIVLFFGFFYSYFSKNKVDISASSKTQNLLLVDAEASLENKSPKYTENILPVVDTYVEAEKKVIDTQNYKLIGVMITKDAKQALIRDVKKNKVFRCGLGDEVLGGRIEKIEFNKIVIMNKSQMIELYM